MNSTRIRRICAVDSAVVCDRDTNRIFVGTVDETQSGLIDVQQEVTRTATVAVAAYVHALGGAVELAVGGFVYQVQVVRIASPGAGPN